MVKKQKSLIQIFLVFTFPVMAIAQITPALKTAVDDTQAPTITCPANITVNNNQCGTEVTYDTPVATDNCPGATVECVPASGSFFFLGTTTVTVTATDASGNTTKCTFTVTVLSL